MLVDIGIILFAVVVSFQILTLPVEFNASSRALNQLESCGALASDELPKAKKVLNAAAMTYVASVAVSLAQLLRLILISNNRRR
jgi:Zn-dependent membrane protease YugP